MSSKSTSSVEDIVQKLEYYCSYQERCHIEVSEKLRGFVLNQAEKDRIIVHLIESNFLNEERFALVFSISKFHQKKWGKIRIKNELKARKISDYLVTKALKEIPSEEYEMTFETLAEKHWESITEKNDLKKRKKFCDYLLRKGWESERIYEKVKELEK
ncbi:regulatory protein RecX [Flavobacterium sp.]|uniref:regulatory protein RecX n=1 Tax=Flavobacterium sp. TaxID=239 RepID=UPI0026353E15|nr:regulatory protein RecX [Flavobacterium sp.]